MRQLSPEPTVQRGQKHVVILGAGPAGLTAAYELMLHGISATILEKDQHYVGGIARTVKFQGNRIDIGGHRFFTKSAEIDALWTSILGEEMLERARLSHVFFHGRYFSYPLEVHDLIAKLGFIEVLRCSISYLWAHMHPIKRPFTYEDWATNEFGKRLFTILLKPYTEKVWGMSTREMSADWAAQRIRRLNVKSLLMRLWSPVAPANGKLRSTLVDHFRYPRLGPGQMWERLHALLEIGGQQVFLGKEVVGICHDGTRVTHVAVRDECGEIHEIEGTDIISTLPLAELVNICCPQLPREVQEAASALKYRNFITVALLINKENVFPDNWIYLPDSSVKAGRVQNFKNWSDAMVANPKNSCLGLEYFCTPAGDLWSMTDEELEDLARRELVTLGMCHADEIVGGKVVRQAKAYPVYDRMYETHVAVVRKYIESGMTNLQLIGRNGMHRYNNQDHAMMTALLAARNIALGAHLDPWQVNTEAQYHEEGQLYNEQDAGRHAPGQLKGDMIVKKAAKG